MSGASGEESDSESNNYLYEYNPNYQNFYYYYYDYPEYDDRDDNRSSDNAAVVDFSNPVAMRFIDLLTNAEICKAEAGNAKFMRPNCCGN